MLAERVSPLSEADYLAMEAESSCKHEFLAGEVYALAGATEAHNRLVTNLIVELGLAARGTRCRVLGSDMKLRIAETQPDGQQRVVYYYPDIQVVCDATDTEPQFKMRPCAIVEVSSRSTEIIDTREKLLAFRGIESLRDYVIVSQDRRRVVRHYRDERGAWWKAEQNNQGSVAITCLTVDLNLDGIYEGVI